MWHNIRGTEGAELLFPNSDRKTTFLFIHPDWSSSVWSLATAHNVWSLREQVTPLLSLAGGTKMFSRWVQPKSVCVHKATEDGHACRMPPASICSYFDRITILQPRLQSSFHPIGQFFKKVICAVLPKTHSLAWTYRLNVKTLKIFTRYKKAKLLAYAPLDMF